MVTCANCRFWDQQREADTTAKCRRYAPAIGKWPETNATDWCGDAVEMTEQRSVQPGKTKRFSTHQQTGGY